MFPAYARTVGRKIFIAKCFSLARILTSSGLFADVKMLIKEFRITLPMTVEEYQVAQLYCVSEVSKENTGGGEGIEVLKNEPFKNFPLLDGKYSEGQYTHKIYHVSSKVPAFIRAFLPKGSFQIHEEAWNAYPYCRTVVTNPSYLKDDFHIIIESFHADDSGTEENVHKLSEDKLKLRQIVKIDIATDPADLDNYKKEEDPKLFRSKKTGRGPLIGNWVETAKPLMTCYKLVTAELKWSWFGLNINLTMVENNILSAEQQIFLNFHRLVFCSMDKWCGLTVADVRAIEEKVKKELDEARNKGEVRGNKL